jgi:hypothetical protein
MTQTRDAHVTAAADVDERALQLGSDVLPYPAAPQTLEESGLSLDMITPLVLKTLYFVGELTGRDIAQRLGVNFPVIEPSLEFLKRERQVEIGGGAMFGGPAFRYRITDAGRARAGLFLEHNHYVGLAPVPLVQYRAYLAEFERRVPKATTPAGIRRALSNLVLNDHILDQLGSAVGLGQSMFVYGPPGNGKTMISRSLHNLMAGHIAIPYALEVEGSIIRFFDPINHEERPLPEENEGTHLLYDHRWVRCRRPMIVVGGELTLNALEAHYNKGTGFYKAPIQAIANGGILVIDDFGRQQCSPSDLLNRWMVPLESRIDHLTLQTGQQFEIPFTSLIVFNTNLKPADLVDEAFLRRIQAKIHAAGPTVEEFLEIFERNCVERDLPFSRELVEEMLATYFRPRGIPLRGCHPRDLLNQVASMLRYRGAARELTLPLLYAACESYFVDNYDQSASYA